MGQPHARPPRTRGDARRRNYDGPMDHKAEVQKLIDACEAVIKCAYENDGLSQAECETVLFYARTLLLEVKPQCVENHSRDKKLNADKP